MKNFEEIRDSVEEFIADLLDNENLIIRFLVRLLLFPFVLIVSAFIIWVASVFYWKEEF